MSDPPGLTRSSPRDGGRDLGYLKAWISARSQGGEGRSEGLRADLERLFTHVFNKSRDGISIHALDFTIVGVNTTMQDWYSPGRTLAGRKCYEAYHGRDRPCAGCPFETAVQTRRPQIGVVPYQVSGRALGDQELSVFPLLDGDRQVLCGLEYVRDITPLGGDARILERLRRHIQLQEHTLHEQETALAVLLRQVPRVERRAAEELAENLDALVMPQVARLRARCAGTELARRWRSSSSGSARSPRAAPPGWPAPCAASPPASATSPPWSSRGGRARRSPRSLRISPRSVDFHRTNIRRKLGLGRAAGSLQSLLVELEYPSSTLA